MREQPMFNRVVLGSVRRIMGDANLKAEGGGEGLQVLLENVVARAVAAATITQQQSGGRVRILPPPMMGPPVMHRITGKFRRIPTSANLNKALILGEVI